MPSRAHKPLALLILLSFLVGMGSYFFCLFSGMGMGMSINMHCIDRAGECVLLAPMERMLSWQQGLGRGAEALTLFTSFVLFLVAISVSAAPNIFRDTQHRPRSTAHFIPLLLVLLFARGILHSKRFAAVPVIF